MDAASIVLVGPSGEQYELRSVSALRERRGRIVTDGRFAASVLRFHLLSAAFDVSQVVRTLRDLLPGWTPVTDFGSSMDAETIVARVVEELERGDGGRLELRVIDARRVISDGGPAAELEVRDLAELADEVPAEEPTTWFEVRLEDELGQAISGIGLSMMVDGTRESVTTDGGGTARFDEAHTSFASVSVADHPALRSALVERWSEVRDGEWMQPNGHRDHTFLRYGEPLPAVALESKTPHTVVLQPRVSRVRLVGGMFDTNKTFLLPRALHHIQSICSLYEQHPKAELLLVGHTDTSGDVAYNETLSLERADSMKAYLTDDVDAWLAWYGSGKPQAKRWGDIEDRAMLEAVLLRRGVDPSLDPVRSFQAAESLEVDGLIGPNTRRALVTRYMGIDGTSLPEGIEPVTHGCGEAFPLADDGVALDHQPRDGQDDATDRRVELFFFDAPLGILPAAPGSISKAGSKEYPEWRRRAARTDDFVVRDAKTIAVKVTDAATGQPLVGASVQLSGRTAVGADAKPGGGGERKTDEFGVVVFADLDHGDYEVAAQKPSHKGEVVEHEVAPSDPPKVIPVELEAAIGGLVVTVTDDHSGAPMKDVDVRIDGPHAGAAMTDASGNATFEDIPAGDYTVEAATADYSPFSSTATVSAGATSSLPVELASTKPRQGSLAITVHDQAGNPVANADVRLGAGASGTVTGDAKGEASLGPVNAGDYELQAIADWFALSTKKVTVLPDQTTTVTIVLAPLTVGLTAKLFWNRTWNYNDHTTPIAAVKEFLPMAKVELRVKPKGGATLAVHATDFADKDGKVDFKAVPRPEAIELRVLLEHEGSKVTAFKGDSNAVAEADFEVKTDAVAWHQFPLTAAQLAKIDGRAAKVDLGEIEIKKALFVDMCDCYKSIWFGHSRMKTLAGVDLPYCELRYPSTTTSFHRGGKLYLLKLDLKDRDVLLHEYGHFITGKQAPAMSNAGYDYDDGNGTIGSHGRTTKEHYESAWMEAMATFLSCAMTDDPHYHDGYDGNLSYHLDKDNTQIGAHSEGSVQEALWDTYKRQGVAFKKLWKALTNTSKMKVDTAVRFHENWGSLGIADHAKLVAAYHKLNMKFVYGYKSGGDRFKAVVAPKTFSEASKEFTTVDELYDHFGKLGGGTKAEYLEELYNRNNKFNAGQLGAGSSRTDPKITAGNSYIVPVRQEVK